MSNERIIPKVNVIGAVAKWFISKFDIVAFRVTVENIGKLIPWFLAISEVVYVVITKNSMIEMKYVLKYLTYIRGIKNPLM